MLAVACVRADSPTIPKIKSVLHLRILQVRSRWALAVRTQAYFVLLFGKWISLVITSSLWSLMNTNAALPLPPDFSPSNGLPHPPVLLLFVFAPDFHQAEAHVNHPSRRTSEFPPFRPCTQMPGVWNLRSSWKSTALFTCLLKVYLHFCSKCLAIEGCVLISIGRLLEDSHVC